MKTYIVLLRGINVGGQKAIKMTQLKEILLGMGYTAVKTYIQSGNIVLKSRESSSRTLSKSIKKGIQRTFGHEVQVLVKTPMELEDIFNKSGFEKLIESESKKCYYVMFMEPPAKELALQIQQQQFPNEHFMITENCVYLSCDLGYGKAKCNNNFFEKKLQLAATTRNHRTVKKLLELAEMY